MNTYYQFKNGGNVKDIDQKEGIITGYFSTFGAKDSDGDIIMPGAYRKTLAENGPDAKNGGRIMHLLQHDPLLPLSKPKVLKEDGYGLYFESKISGTSYGRDTLKLYEDGVLTEHSIGYKVIKNEPKEDANYLLELRLWEGSTVTWGANADALVTGVKAEDRLTLYDKLIKKLEAMNLAIKHNYTDETIIQLELQIKQLQQIIKSLADTEKPQDTPPVKPEPSMSASEMLRIIKSKINN